MHGLYLFLFVMFFIQFKKWDTKVLNRSPEYMYYLNHGKYGICPIAQSHLSIRYPHTCMREVHCTKSLKDYSHLQMTSDFQQCAILTSVDSDEPV